MNDSSTVSSVWNENDMVDAVYFSIDALMMYPSSTVQGWLPSFVNVSSTELSVTMAASESAGVSPGAVPVVSPGAMPVVSAWSTACGL